MQRALGDNAEAADVYFAMLIIDFPPPRMCCVRIPALRCSVNGTAAIWRYVHDFTSKGRSCELN
jgi:hypothetical protein